MVQNGRITIDQKQTQSHACNYLRDETSSVVEFAYLKRALSSEKPDASASTAADVPILRKANMARYLSNSGSSVLRSFSFSDDICASVTSSGAGWPDRRREDGGAGSIEVYVLSSPGGHVRKGEITRDGRTVWYPGTL